jgi:hypothetical protein
MSFVSLGGSGTAFSSSAASGPASDVELTVTCTAPARSVKSASALHSVYSSLRLAMKEKLTLRRGSPRCSAPAVTGPRREQQQVVVHRREVLGELDTHDDVDRGGAHGAEAAAANLTR